ncbi:MAG: hypothetical protein CMB99_12735 [Flavobacteriaceae bacterium]|nr:hypothetical protein [Flavobacteriaceae bacterium]
MYSIQAYWPAKIFHKIHLIYMFNTFLNEKTRPKRAGKIAMKKKNVILNHATKIADVQKPFINIG